MVRFYGGKDGVTFIILNETDFNISNKGFLEEEGIGGGVGKQSFPFSVIKLAELAEKR